MNVSHDSTTRVYEEPSNWKRGKLVKVCINAAKRMLVRGLGCNACIARIRTILWYDVSASHVNESRDILEKPIRKDKYMMNHDRHCGILCMCDWSLERTFVKCAYHWFGFET